MIHPPMWRLNKQKKGLPVWLWMTFSTWLMKKRQSYRWYFCLYMDACNNSKKAKRGGRKKKKNSESIKIIFLLVWTQWHLPLARLARLFASSITSGELTEREIQNALYGLRQTSGAWRWVKISQTLTHYHWLEWFSGRDWNENTRAWPSKEDWCTCR